MSGATRDQMVQTAVRLFQRDGYHATTWRALVDEAGTPWGSIGHHFPGGKEELGVAAIDAGGAAVTALIDHCFATTASAPKAVRTWFELSARMMAGGDYRAGCPVATVALETTPTSTALAAASRRAFAGWEEALARHLRAAGARGRAASELATLVVTLLEGALVLARVRESTAPLELAGRQAAALVAARVDGTADHRR